MKRDAGATADDGDKTTVSAAPGDFDSKVVPETMPATARTMAQAATVVEIDRVIGGRYKIVRLLARSAMSRVYLAEQVGIERQVALKIIGREAALEGDAVARFQREARLLARITHPNIVAVHDLGRTEEGEPFIVMEYVPGSSLAAILKQQGRLEPVRVLRLLLQIARALAAVHEEGVIHRDLKSGNVLVLRSRFGAEVAKLADFGLAKVIDRARRESFPTRSGTILGTPEYMAPEQVRGGEIDQRADLYSVGCMAYEMLTGQPPFVGEEMATLYAQLHTPARPLEEAAPGMGIPPAFQPLIDRLLAKEPADRHSGALELYAALLGVADEVGVSRRELQIHDTLFEDAASALALDLESTAERPTLRATTGSIQLHRRPLERRLLIVTAVAVALVGGVALGRLGRSGAPVGLSARPVAAPAGGLLVVSARPADARIAVDGGDSVAAPALFHEIAPGKHLVLVTRNGFVPAARELSIAAGEVELVDVALERPTYVAHIETEPAGAAVVVDGREVGHTPVEVPLTEGEFHEIAARLDGYQPRTRLIGVLERGERTTLVLRPALLRYGSLFVDAPARARVLIDGVDLGESTPTGELQVAPGKHTVTLVEGVGSERSKRVDVKANDTIRVVF